MGVGGVRVTGGRGLYGVSERGWCELSSGLSQPGGKKLLSSLAERALMLRNRLPDGRSWKRLWEGWVGSFTILVAYWRHRARKMSQDGGGRGIDDLFSCVHCPLEGLVVCCTTVPVPDSDTAGQHALNGSPVEVVRMGGGRLASFQPVEKV